MAKDHRITRTRRHAYRTKTNKVKTIRTPGNFNDLRGKFYCFSSNHLIYNNLGGRYAAKYLKKGRKGVKCGDCDLILPGVIFVNL